jgi:hypothetical protein
MYRCDVDDGCDSITSPERPEWYDVRARASKTCMARTQEVVETITCDLCGRPADEDLTVTLGWDGEQWRVDLCQSDYNRVATQFDKWISNGEPAATPKPRTRRRKRSGIDGSDDWTYLESRGFKRHRGRKNAAEVEALASRAR